MGVRLVGGALLLALALQGCNSDDKPGADGGSGANASGGSRAPDAAPVLSIPVDPHAQGPAARALAADTGTNPGCFSAVLPRRLTRTQFINVLSDWSATLVADTGLPARIRTLVVDKAQFPQDASINPETARHQGYWRLDPTVTTRQVGGINTIAQDLAADLASTDARAAAILGNCSGEACLTAFIRKAGRTLFRQPLTDAEVAVYRKVANGATDRAALVKVLATMIASPQTYFVVERGNGSGSGACVPLSAHELAARLSLHLWDTLPDAALAARADDGTLLQPAVYQSQVTRLMGDARADLALRSFFRQWFRLDDLVAMDGKVGNARFDAFAAGYRPLGTTRDAAIDEVLDMVSYVAARNGSLQQVLTDRHSFARTADIATLYKTAVWNGTGTPPVFTEADRVGLLTRVAVIANGSSDTTLPISRGAKILSALTCQPLPPPAMNQTNAGADLSGVLTTRERTTRVTEMEGTACVGCHKTSLNPWGFVLERFDALGRVRATEVVRNDAGAVLGERPLDTAVVANLEGIAGRSISTAAQAQQFVLDSGAFEACFARNYFRYAFGRADGNADKPVIEEVRQQAANGANLRSLFASIVTRNEFKTIQRPQ